MVCELCEEMIANISTVNWTEAIIPESLVGGALGGVLVALGIFLVIGVIIFMIALYAYQALAWMTIAKRQKHKYPWLAWIPFAATAMRLQMGGFHWAWVFLWIFPPAAIVLVTIAIWRIFKVTRYPAWFSLSYPAMFIPAISGIGKIAYYIMIGFIAWKDKR